MQTASCPFCAPPAGDALRNALAYARFDANPVTPGHMLLIPYRHVSSWFETTEAERQALWHLLDQAKAELDTQHHPAGCNIGINVGQAAGQTVAHVHIHLIPRYPGDVAEPRGGVRGVIPAKQSY